MAENNPAEVKLTHAQMAAMARDGVKQMNVPIAEAQRAVDLLEWLTAIADGELKVIETKNTTG